jgi:hypothetical protein
LLKLRNLATDVKISLDLLIDINHTELQSFNGWDNLKVVFLMYRSLYQRSVGDIESFHNSLGSIIACAVFSAVQRNVMLTEL